MLITLPLTTLLTPLFTAPAFAGFEVSSFKKEDRLGKNYWNAASALDGKLETCWQVDPEQNNIGQWIQIDVPGGTVDKVGLVIGWQKSEEVFLDHARIKAAKVEIIDMTGGTAKVVATTTATLEDKMGWQYIDLPDTKVGAEIYGGKVKITVTEVYGGKDFPNLAVSEARVHLKEFPAESLTLTVPFNNEVGSNSGAMAFDKNPKTYWAGTGSSATFSVKAAGYGLSSIGFQSGPKTHARPKTVEMSANGAMSTAVLEDKPGTMVWALLPCLVGYTGGAWGEVQVKILDSYPGDQPTNGLALAEVKVNAGSIEDF